MRNFINFTFLSICRRKIEVSATSAYYRKLYIVHRAGGVSHLHKRLDAEHLASTPDIRVSGHETISWYLNHRSRDKVPREYMPEWIETGGSWFTATAIPRLYLTITDKQQGDSL